MRGHRQDSAQKWGLPCRWLFLFFLGKNRCETDLCSTKIGGEQKIFSFGGLTLMGSYFRISERFFEIFRRRVDFAPRLFTDMWGDLILPTAPWQLNTRHPGDHNREDAAPTQTSVKCRWEPRAKIYWMTASKMQCCSVFWNFNQTVR